MTLTLSLLVGILLDRLFGEVSRWHPLVGFGTLAQWLERHLNQGKFRLVRGACGWLILVLPPSLLAGLLLYLPVPHWLINGIALYFALGARALIEHGRAVAEPLLRGDLSTARARTAYLVSRETTTMDERGAATATVESLLENGNDAIFGALFWCVVAGAPGVVLFRLVNTLDAMWGYRNARFNLFGRVAARMDDVMNYLPARLTALSYALLGQTRHALRCWRQQAPHWSSPNAGPVMSSGAGSLNIELGGAAVYEGEIEARPVLGTGAPACAQDIARATRLIQHSMLLWCIAVLVLEALFYVH